MLNHCHRVFLKSSLQILTMSLWKERKRKQICRRDLLEAFRYHMMLSGEVITSDLLNRCLNHVLGTKKRNYKQY